MLKPGQAAPDFALLDMQGHSLDLQAILAQSPVGVVVLFFASDFLSADVAMLKGFASHASVFRQAGVCVVALSALNWETLHHAQARLELPYPVLFDACARVATRYQAALIPKFLTGRAVYVLNAHGEVMRAGRNLSPDEALRVLSVASSGRVDASN